MGALTISVNSTASGTLSKAFTIPDADIARLLAFAKATYPVAVPAVLNSDGSVQTPATTRTPTNAEAMLAWAQGIMAGTVANVKNYETTQAMAADASTVTSISAT